MEVFERRRLKLAELLSDMSAAELSRKTGIAASYISRCTKTPLEQGYKSIGELTARRIEAGARRPEGWLDDNPRTQASPAVIAPNFIANQPDRRINSAQAATDNVATLVGALTALQTLLQQADSLDRAACKPIIAAMLDDPDRGDLIQKIINVLEPPTKQREPETGARRRIV